MAGEISVAGSISATKSGSTVALSLGPLTFDLTGTLMVQNRQALSNSEEALDLCGMSGTLGWCLIVNRDAAITVSVRQATSASNFCDIEAGEFALFRFASGTTAPFVIGASGTPEIEYVLLTN